MSTCESQKHCWDPSAACQLWHSLQALKTCIMAIAEQHMAVKKGSGLVSRAGIPPSHAFVSTKQNKNHSFVVTYSKHRHKLCQQEGFLLSLLPNSFLHWAAPHRPFFHAQDFRLSLGNWIRQVMHIKTHSFWGWSCSLPNRSLLVCGSVSVSNSERQGFLR